MMRVPKWLLTLGASLPFLMCQPASAATLVTFDELAHNESVTFHNPLTINGFVFTSSLHILSSLGVWGLGTSQNADPDGATLFNGASDLTTTITAQSGGLFDFTSIDLADAFNNGTGGSVFFTFNDGSSSATQSVVLDNNVGLQTFVFNRTNLLSVAFTPLTSRAIQLDNVRFGSDVSGAVPEPGTWAMMLLGFGFVGGAMRSAKRSQKLTISYA